MDSRFRGNDGSVEWAYCFCDPLESQIPA